jgi:hypothetical protein
MGVVFELGERPKFPFLGDSLGFRAPRLNSSVLAGEQKTGEAPFFLLRYWE